MDKNKSSSARKIVALGVFDGVHKGHKSVFEMTCDSYLEPAVFTFDTESIHTKHGKEYLYIMPNSRKLDVIRNSGIEFICCTDFSEIKGLSAEEFVKDILIGQMNAGAVVCGPNFRFGRGAAGDTELLRNLGKKYNFDVSIASPVIIDGQTVSSSAVREMIASGDIKRAGRFLGSEYEIVQTVVKGKQIGRTINFPTINQSFQTGQLVPRYGVYATMTEIDGRMYSSVTNIGVKPTVTDEKIPLAETYIIDFSGDLYEKILRVVFVDFIREECRFGSLNELREQIKKDIKAASGLGGVLKIE